MSLSPRSKAILQALFVTMLWSSSIILIKKFLVDVPPLAYTGIRYMLAFLFLLPGLLKRRGEVKRLTSFDWRYLVILGLVYYTITQGGQFLALVHLDAITMSLLLSFTGPLVAVLGLIFLKEPVSRLQWTGMAIFLAGVLIYFLPVTTIPKSVFGMGLALFTMIANSIAAVMGRGVNRDQRLDPMVVTGISMGIGAVVLLGGVIIFQGLPPLDLRVWLLLVLIAGLNTALAFWIWNRTLQSLTAMESSMINNSMLIQITLLAWIFLGESISLIGLVGLIIAVVGLFLVNWQPAKRNA